MRKQLISSFVGLLLVGMGSQAFGQQTGWQGSIALPAANSSLSQWTNNHVWGVCLDGSYGFALPNSRSVFRPGMGLNVFPGKEGDFSIASTAPRTISLTSVQLNADLVVPLGNSSVSFVSGFSLNTWIKNVSGKLGYQWGEKQSNGTVVIHPAGTVDNNVSGTVDNIFGKFGLRFGIDYALNDKVTLAVMLQMTDLGTDAEFLDLDKFRSSYTSTTAENPTNMPLAGGNVAGKRAVVPSWLQFGVRYHF
ncbi:MAG: hypothetical protein FWG12_07980 [Holophagaceae bacterium]|nr:hypothetical protein [Holophagaceae bacterium]